MAEKSKKVTVQSLQLHTYDGKEYAAGKTYDVDAELVDSLVVQGKAAPVDAAAVAPKAAELRVTKNQTAEAPLKNKAGMRGTKKTKK